MTPRLPAHLSHKYRATRPSHTLEQNPRRWVSGFEGASDPWWKRLHRWLSEPALR